MPGVTLTIGRAPNPKKGRDQLRKKYPDVQALDSTVPSLAAQVLPQDGSTTQLLRSRAAAAYEHTLRNWF